MVEDQIKALLGDPQKLLTKRPFVRGTNIDTKFADSTVQYNEAVQVSLPTFTYTVIDQAEYVRELDPASHKVLNDGNIPSITAKVGNDTYAPIEHKRLAVAYQRKIKDKQVLHLCGNPLDFTMMETDPDQKQEENFVIFKQYWNLRNQDGMKTKFVDAQKSFGDAGLLYYMDYRGRIKSRLLSYPDYIVIPHNDDNGDRILETVYYKNEDGEFIDSYDDKFLYRKRRNINSDSTNKAWIDEIPKEHGFNEIPLITKRGNVAWDNVQTLIEVYEILYNIFVVIQKRHGWGLLYIKGNFSEQTKKLAGSVILKDTDISGNGDAKYLTPPDPQGTIDTLNLLEESIQKGSGTTFILPKDIKASGDVSGIAVQLTQSMDIETALQGVIEWQNVADKMTRLFKYGLSKELVASGINRFAITEFDTLKISAKFKVWKPQSEYEFAQMLIMLKSAGILSQESGVELNPVSKPHEKARIAKEKELEIIAQSNAEQQAIQQTEVVPTK